jgi:hypothetical protein
LVYYTSLRQINLISAFKLPGKSTLWDTLFDSNQSMDIDDPLILDVQSTLTRLNPFKHSFPSFDNVLDVFLPYDISIPGQDFVKGADQGGEKKGDKKCNCKQSMETFNYLCNQ